MSRDKQKQKEYMKQYQANPTNKQRRNMINKTSASRSRRNNDLKQRYGITVQDEDNMLFNQMGMCANEGCNRLATDIDHCHTTNNIRGILCHQCNLALGLLKDNYNFIKGLLEYIS